MRDAVKNLYGESVTALAAASGVYAPALAGGDAAAGVAAAGPESGGASSGSINGSSRAVVLDGPAATGPWVDIPPYQGDVLVRGSEALGKTKDGHVTRNVI